MTLAFRDAVELTIKEIDESQKYVSKNDSSWITNGLRRLLPHCEYDVDTYACLRNSIEQSGDAAIEIQLLNSYEVLSRSVIDHNNQLSFKQLGREEYKDFNDYFLKRNLQYCEEGNTDGSDRVAKPGKRSTGCFSFSITHVGKPQLIRDENDPANNIFTFFVHGVRFPYPIDDMKQLSLDVEMIPARLMIPGSLRCFNQPGMYKYKDKKAGDKIELEYK